MKFVKFMPAHSLVSASRNKREIGVLLDLGADVTIISRDAECPVEELKNVCAFKNDGGIPLSQSVPSLKRKFYVLKNSFNLYKLARGIEADVVSCHDLNALKVMYFSKLFIPKKKRPKLVYDSHEFTLGLAKYKHPLKRKIAACLEKFLMKRCAFSIMVNEAISNRVQKEHGLKETPVSVKNAPQKWLLDSNKTEGIRRIFESSLNITEKDAFIAMYHGAIIPGRGIEVFIDAIAKNENIYGVILGDFSHESYERKIKELANSDALKGRIAFFPAVSHKELKNYISAVDCGVSLLQNTCENHLYALPNKFFECIQSLTPVVVSDFPAIGRVVDEYEIGLKCDSASSDDVAKAFEKMRTDKDLYNCFKKNLLKAKEELCWENEKQKLFDAYKNILEK